MSDIKPIETVYNGYKFRSRLEARWAVFFDSLGIEYQYEPDGFVGLDDIKYLPDFYLTKAHVYVEVKGTDEALKKDARKITAAIDFDATPISTGIIIVGDIPNPDKISWGNIPMFNYLYCKKGIVSEYAAFTDSVFQPMKVARGNDDILIHLFSYDEDFSDYFGEDGALPNNVSVNCIWSKENMLSRRFENLKAAYTKARQARFEHGETPIVRKP